MRKGFSSVGLVAGLCLAPFLVFATEEGASPCWVVPAGEGAECRSVPRDWIGTASPGPLLLWQQGRGFLAVESGSRIPAEVSQGVANEVLVRDGSGNPLRDVELEYRPANWSNLPEPMGRVWTDSQGKACLFLEPGGTALLWIATPVFLPSATVVEAGSPPVLLKAEPAPPGSLRLEDSNHRALGGASVLFLPPSSPLHPLELARQKEQAIRRLRADAQGFVSLGAEEASLSLLAWAKGHGVLEVPPREGPKRVVLARANPVRVRIGLPERTPHKWRAEVRYAHLGLPWLSTSEEWAYEGECGTVFPQGYPCKILVQAEGCAGEEIALKVPPASEVAVHLSKAVVLEGFVRSGEGRPVNGAVVTLGVPGGRPYAITDARGHFSLPPQAEGDAPWDLFVSADDYLEGELRNLPVEKAGECAIVLTRGAGITGRVEEEGEGHAPESLRVRVEALSGISSQGAGFDATLEEDGSFSVFGLEEGRYRLQASAAGRRSPLKTVEVETGIVSDAGILYLGTRPKVSGRLESKEGENLDAREAEIWLKREMGPREVASGAEKSFKADRKEEDGTFAFFGVPDGTYRVEARVGDLGGRSGVVRVEGEDVEAGTLSLQEEVTVKGRLMARLPKDWSGYRVVLQSGVLDYEGPSATADREGLFRLGPVAPGGYTLAVFEPFSIVPKIRRPLQVDGSLEDQELRIFLDGVNLPVQARLDGRPAAGAVLSFEAAHDEAQGAPLAIGTPEGMIVLGFPSPLASAPTDGGGFALLVECPVGPGTAVLSWNGGRWTRPVVVPETPKETVVWDFQGLVLSGRVENEQGDPVPALPVQWEYAGQGALPDGNTTTDGAGAFSISGLAPARVRIRASDPERGAAEAVVDLSMPRPNSLVLRLRRPTS